MLVSIVLLVIFIPALVRRTPVYDSLLAGASDGLRVIVRILPAMIAVMSAASMLRASGALDFIIGLICPITDVIGIPEGVLPMALMRPVSGSGSMGLLADNLSNFGPDSTEGLISSVIMGSTETTFYTLAVYFGATGVKHAKRAVVCAIIGDVVGLLVAVFVIKWFFGG